MPTTSFAGLRYPIGSDAPNVPQYIQQLASDVDKQFQPDEYPLLGTSGFNLTTSLIATIDGSGRKHLDGWVRNAATMTPQAGEALFIIPPEMRPVSPRFVLVGVNVGQTVAHIDINTDGWVRVARTIPVSIPADSVWSFDGVSYR